MAAPNIVEEEGTTVDAPLVSKRRRKRANEESNVNAPRKETPVGTMNPDTISFAKASSGSEQDIAQLYMSVLDPGLPRELLLREDHNTPSSCQELMDHLAPPGYFSELRHLPNEEFLGQFNMTLARQVAMGSQMRVRIRVMEGEKKNLETLLEAEADMRKATEAKKAELAQVTREEKIKATFEEFKKYEDERVSARSAEIDSKLDALSIDFDEELYRHMLKCAESLELRQTFANVVSAGITKGFCNRLSMG
ncbi:hypothetical protein Tco_1552768 [Tanacetum coccineum]